VLERYVRDNPVLTLEQAIRKMTSFPAQRLGLWDRGVLKPGAWRISWCWIWKESMTGRRTCGRMLIRLRTFHTNILKGSIMCLSMGTWWWMRNGIREFWRVKCYVGQAVSLPPNGQTASLFSLIYLTDE